MTVERECLVVNVTKTDCYGIQAALKFNNVMLSPFDNKPVFPIETIPILRVRFNHALLRFIGEPGLAYVPIVLSYAECWCIDWVLSVNAWDGADKLLAQVLMVMAEHEMDLHLLAPGEGKDLTFDRLAEAQFAEWIVTQGKKG